MKRLLMAVVAAAALWAAACGGGGGSTITPPPPTGNYKLASLNGTYAFVTSGEVTTSTTTATSFARTGSFTADGAGGIKAGGVYDVVNARGSSTTSSAPIPITGGSYTVNPDGRGTLTLNVNSNGAPATINFAFVLTSASDGLSPASDGLMIDETSTASQASTGSGNFIKQNTTAFQSGVSAISGSHVFDLSGLDAGQVGESLVGQFAAANGVVTSGFEDANDGGALSSGSIAPGSLTADPTNMTTSGRGTAVIANQTYAFYIVDSTRVRFISINSTGTGPMLVGDAVSQSSNLPTGPSAINGNFAFLVGGSSAHGGLTRVGRFTVTNGVLSKILMDVNDAASETQVNNLSSGSITAFDPTTGRGTFSFQSPTTNYSFVFYLSSPNDGVIQEVTAPTGSSTAVVVDDGSIALQSGNPFTASNISGNYAMNWSGLETSGSGFQDEEDLVSQVKISNLSLSGTSDIFQFTSTTLTPQTDIGTGGTITFNGGDGAGDDGIRVDMNVNLSGAKSIDMVVYIVNPQLAFFANRDNNGTPRIVAGILKAQQ